MMSVVNNHNHSAPNCFQLYLIHKISIQALNTILFQDLISKELDVEICRCPGENLYKRSANAKPTVRFKCSAFNRKRRRTHQGVNTNAGERTLERSYVLCKRTFVFFKRSCSLQTQARTCHDHNVQQEQFSVIYHHYGIRKLVQMLTTVVYFRPRSCDKLCDQVTSLGN